MRNLNFELKQLCRRSRDGSFATQRDRERVLDLVAGQLQELGYRHMAAASLKPKHVEGLVERWQAEGLAIGTIKNRMAELRWWAEKIGKQNVIARDNDHYGIGNRRYVTNISKARELSGSELSRITDPFTAMSLQLQAAFGLRRGESIKIRPEWADRGNHHARPGCANAARTGSTPLRRSASNAASRAAIACAICARMATSDWYTRIRIQSAYGLSLADRYQIDLSTAANRRPPGMAGAWNCASGPAR